MGIFELLILISAALVFIILVRRFPETAEDIHQHGSKQTARWSFHVPKITLPRLRSKTNLPLPFQDGNEPEPEPAIMGREPAQAEPGTSADDLKTLPIHLRKHLSDAQQFFENKDYSEAEELYLAVAAEDPTCVLAYNRLGLIYLDRENGLLDAEEAFYQALKYEPANGYLIDNIGQVAFHKGHYNEAIKFYEQALAIDAAITVRHSHLGLAYLSLRQYAKAIRHLSKAWALEPKNAEYKQLLDDAKERERRQRLERSHP